MEKTITRILIECHDTIRYVNGDVETCHVSFYNGRDCVNTGRGFETHAEAFQFAKGAEFALSTMGQSVQIDG